MCGLRRVREKCPYEVTDEFNMGLGQRKLFINISPRPFPPPMSSIRALQALQWKEMRCLSEDLLGEGRSLRAKGPGDVFSMWEPSSWPRDLTCTMYPH